MTSAENPGPRIFDKGIVINGHPGTARIVDNTGSPKKRETNGSVNGSCLMHFENTRSWKNTHTHTEEKRKSERMQFSLKSIYLECVVEISNHGTNTDHGVD